MKLDGRCRHSQKTKRSLRSQKGKVNVPWLVFVVAGDDEDVQLVNIKYAEMKIKNLACLSGHFVALGNVNKVGGTKMFCLFTLVGRMR